MKGPLHPTRIDIPIEVRSRVIELIGVTLCSVQDLYFQCKQAHWNVKGPNFMPFHEFFDSLAEPLIETIDSLAERINQLGGTSLGTIRIAAMVSILPEFPYNTFGAMGYTEALAQRFALIAKNMRDSAKEMGTLGDITTQDIYLGMVENFDKKLWFIESFLQPEISN